MKKVVEGSILLPKKESTTKKTTTEEVLSKWLSSEDSENVYLEKSVKLATENIFFDWFQLHPFYVSAFLLIVLYLVSVPIILFLGDQIIQSFFLFQIVGVLASILWFVIFTVFLSIVIVVYLSEPKPTILSRRYKRQITKQANVIKEMDTLGENREYTEAMWGLRKARKNLKGIRREIKREKRKEDIFSELVKNITEILKIVDVRINDYTKLRRQAKAAVPKKKSTSSKASVEETFDEEVSEEELKTILEEKLRDSTKILEILGGYQGLPELIFFYLPGTILLILIITPRILNLNFTPSNYILFYSYLLISFAICCPILMFFHDAFSEILESLALSTKFKLEIKSHADNISEKDYLGKNGNYDEAINGLVEIGKNIRRVRREIKRKQRGKKKYLELLKNIETILKFVDRRIKKYRKLRREAKAADRKKKSTKYKSKLKPPDEPKIIEELKLDFDMILTIKADSKEIQEKLILEEPEQEPIVSQEMSQKARSPKALEFSNLNLYVSLLDQLPDNSVIEELEEDLKDFVGEMKLYHLEALKILVEEAKPEAKLGLLARKAFIPVSRLVDEINEIAIEILEDIIIDPDLVQIEEEDLSLVQNLVRWAKKHSLI